MKKILSILLCLSIIFTCAVPAFAQSSPIFLPTENDTITATLVGENGETVTVIGHKIDSVVSAQSLEPVQSQSLTYVFDITSANLSGNTSRDGTDGSVSVHVYATINYAIDSSMGVDRYRITSVTGHWSILDSSVSVTSASVLVRCSDSNISQEKDYSSVSNYYSFYPGFTQYVHNTAPYGMIGSKTTVNLKMTKGSSSRTWSFSLNCLL